MAKKRKKARRSCRDKRSKIAVDFTPEELARVERAAAAEGMSPEDWLVKAGMQNDAVREQTTEEYDAAGAALVDLAVEDRLWIGRRVSEQGQKVLAHGWLSGIKTEAGREAMIRFAQKYVDENRREVLVRFAAHTRDVQQAVFHYFRTALAEWINTGALLVAKVQYAASLFSEDEFILWTHLYHHTHGEGATEADPFGMQSRTAHRVRFRSDVAAWYSEMDEGGEKEACILAANDYFDAYPYIGHEVMQAIVRGEQPEVSRKPGRGAVRAYLRCVRQTHEAATREGAVKTLDGSADHDRARQLARLLWASLRNSRVFEITAATYQAISEEVYHHVWSNVANLPAGGTTIADLGEEEGRAAYDRVWDEAQRLPVFGDIMPFDHMFFGLDDGIRLDDARIDAMLSVRPRNLIRARLIGVLVGPVYGGAGIHCVMFVRVTEAGGKDYVVPCAERIGNSETEAQWANPALLYPWIVNALLSYVHEHRTTIIENAPSKNVRRQYGRLARGGGMTIIPQPFYTVPLRDSVIEDEARKAVRGVAKRAPLSYRHDRRGHERCRIRRGKLPLDEKTRTKLTKRGYKVFTVQGLDSDAQRQLSERGQPPKRMDEWLAIKTAWIDAMVVGPKDAPYVPGVRVSARSGMFDTKKG